MPKRRTTPRLGDVTDTLIAKLEGVSVSAITQRRRRAGIARARDPRHVIWNADAESMLGMLPAREIASALGISRDTVARRLAALGAQAYGSPRPRKRLGVLDGALYVREVRAGARIADVARRHDRSHATVRLAIARYELRRRATRKRK